MMNHVSEMIFIVIHTERRTLNIKLSVAVLITLVNIIFANWTKLYLSHGIRPADHINDINYVLSHTV